MTKSTVSLALGAALLAAAHPVAAGEIAFVDRAPGFDFSHEYTGGWEHFVGGGVAVFDCNGDRFPDAFLAGGESPSRLIVNRSEPGGPVRFGEHRLPDGVGGGVTGAYPLDIDSDGAMDLVVLRVGENLILRGDGACGFEPANALWGIDGGDGWTTAFSATWEDGKALPTLAFGNYVDRAAPDGPFEACDANWLFRPAGNESYAEPMALEPGHCALSMLFSDWDRRGRADLRISNDRHYYVHDGQEQLWDMSGAAPRLYTANDGWQTLKIWGMGIASRDITGDGLPEVYLTSMADQKLRVREPGVEGPHFRDEAYARGANAHRPYTGDDGRPSAGWHAAFGDVDNDGHDDLFVAKGNVEQMPDMAMRDPNNLLIQQPDGSFVEHGLEAGIASFARARGGALADLNRDGQLDIVVLNRRDNVEILENVSPAEGGWLSVVLTQPAPNPNAVGAWIEVRDGRRHQHREVTVGGGHAGGVAGPEHFGLGDATSIEVRVTWPDGARSPWMPTAANAEVRIVRDAGMERLTD
ncbi:CRTAC1 family protein [Bauldia sp.]|uniref:CRTAC1 family protein n=1 Tax=Bauldia sp. TaxID=2575872 RepID=UPI003BAA33DE